MGYSKNEPSGFKSLVSGGVGGASLIVAGQPLDTIKVRLQTQPVGEKPLFTGTFDCFWKTLRNEGVRGLYKGMPAPLLGALPVYALCFFGYRTGKKLQKSDDQEQLTLWQHYLAGMFAGICTSTIVGPIERVKCSVQVQLAQSNYVSSVECAHKLFRGGGMKNLYKGTCATMLRDVPTFGIFFVTYEWCLNVTNSDREQLNPGVVLVAGGLAGTASWIPAIAPDTLKSRLQTSPPGMYTGVRHVFSDMMRTEGPSALFKGLSPVMIRAFPAYACCFLGVELTMKFLNWALPNW